MDMLSAPFLQAVAWALVHFLWQGALLAFAAWIALGNASGSSSRARYRIASGMLAAMVLAFAGTVLWHLARGPEASAVLAPAMAVLEGGAAEAALLPRLRLMLEARLPWILGAWLLGVSFMALRLGVALGWTYGSCLRGHSAPPLGWEDRFAALRRRLGTSRTVRLVASLRVDTPMVVGWLKPVILVPASAFSAMAPEVLEALLAHELAHLERGDYLANLVQRVAEVIFFYHPAVWWLSARIRQERENCCDDAAVLACGDPLFYASALARMEEIRIRPNLIPELAPAASGGRLMLRIHRLLNPATSPSAVLPGLLASVLALAAVGAFALQASEDQPAPKPKAAKVAPAKSAAGAAAKPSPRKTKEAPSKDGLVDLSHIKVKHQPEPPAYPAEAKAQRIQGTVVVELAIDAAGKITDAKAVSGPQELQPCALEYARSWAFEPCMINGKPAPARFRLTMPFKLR